MALTLDGDNGISGINGSASTPAVQGTDTNTGLTFGTDTVGVVTGGTTRTTVDSSGRLLVGTSTSRNDFFNDTTTVAGGIQLELSASNNLNRFMSFTSNNSDTGGPSVLFGKSRGTSTNSKTIVQNDDQLAALNFHGADGSDMVEAARISAHVDSTPGANDMPGRLVFSTTADGASSPTERMRIASDGTVIIGDTTTSRTTGTGHKFNNTTASIPIFTTVTDDNTPSARVIETFNVNASYNGVRFIVRLDGGISNYQSNDTNLCDEREKRDIVDLDSTWDCLKHWELKKFHYITDTQSDPLRYGVIAQQIVEHCPEVVADFVTQPGSEAVLNDEGTVIQPAQEEIVRMGVKEQQMYWMAIKALQEAQTRIEQLETRVAQLEGGAA